MGMQNIEQPNCERTRRAEAGAMRRNVGDRRNLNTPLDLLLLEHGADKSVLNLRDLLDLFSTRVTETDAIVEFGVHRDIDEALDASADDGPTIAAIIGRHIAATANEADARRCTTDDHLI